MPATQLKYKEQRQAARPPRTAPQQVGRLDGKLALSNMEVYAKGQALASAAVAMAFFFVFAVWSLANLLRTKCKLYEVLLVSAIGKAFTHPSGLACL